ncbi:hypothetical protein JCM19992_11010 [Thermostilla marina]
MPGRKPLVAVHLIGIVVVSLAIVVRGGFVRAEASDRSLPATSRIEWSESGISRIGGRFDGTCRFRDQGGVSEVFLGDQGYITLPVEKLFTPNEGTLSFTVVPDWNGDDGEAHTFVHLADGQCHVTVFKTDNGLLRFAYRGRPEVHVACDLDVSHWRPGERHDVVVGWRPDFRGALWLMLEADGRRAYKNNAVIFSGAPTAIYVGRRGPAAQPAQAWIGDLRVAATPPRLPYADGPKEDVVAVVDCNVRRPLRRVHDCTTIWNSRQRPIPFDENSPEYRLFRQAGFRMVRLVAFSEGWLWGTRVELDDAGRLVTDFSDFDRLLDIFLSAGAEPYVRLAYHTPSALVDPSIPKTERAYAPPADLALWDELMTRIVRHLAVERKVPVRYWVTALNEGDLPVGRGQAVPETIYRLYERTSQIVKRIAPDAKVGGPALARSIDAAGKPSSMLVGFLKYCREHRLPLDFLCFHAYRKAHPREYEAVTRAIRLAVETYYPEQASAMEYVLDEWNQWARTAEQDDEFGAAYLAAALHYQRRAGLTKSSIVSFNHFLPVEQAPVTLIEHEGPFSRSSESPVCYEPGMFTCAGTAREGFRLHPPNGAGTYSFCRVEVDVPENGDPRLEVGTGVVRLPVGGDGCGFQLWADDGARARKLLDVHVRPDQWTTHRISLAAYAGKRIRLEFRTNAGPAGKSTADWAVWGDPRLTVAGENGAVATAWRLLDDPRRAVAGARREGVKFHYDDQTIARYSGLPLIKGFVATTPYFVWVMHNRLADDEVHVSVPGEDGILEDDSGGLTATADANRVVLLLWHFDVLRPESRRWHIELRQLPWDAARLQVNEYRIDRAHNNPYTRYVREQGDDNNGRYNLETAALEETSRTRIDLNEGRAALDVVLPNMAVSLIEIRPE